MRCLMAISLLLSLHAVGARAAGVVRTAARADDERAPLRVLLVNSGPHRILAAYACAPHAASWGDNLLTLHALQPEGQALLELRGGCGTYNLRFVAEGGVEYLDDEVAFCTDREDAQEAGASTAPRAYVVLGRDDLQAVDARPAAPPGPTAARGARRPR